MQRNRFSLQSEVLLYPGMSGWHFLVVPKKQSADIKSRFGTMHKGWGSLPVTVRINKTVWETSIFPDTKSACYLLPLKAQIRKQEGIRSGDSVSFMFTIKT